MHNCILYLLIGYKYIYAVCIWQVVKASLNSTFAKKKKLKCTNSIGMQWSDLWSVKSSNATVVWHVTMTAFLVISSFFVNYFYLIFWFCCCCWFFSIQPHHAQLVHTIEMELAKTEGLTDDRSFFKITFIPGHWTKRLTPSFNRVWCSSIPGASAYNDNNKNSHQTNMVAVHQFTLFIESKIVLNEAD